MSNQAQECWEKAAYGLKRCPVKGCTCNWRTKNGLIAHLFTQHHKSELIAALIDLLGL